MAKPYHGERCKGTTHGTSVVAQRHVHDGSELRACSRRLAFNWESHGNQLNSASRVLKTARDLIEVREALDGEETTTTHGPSLQVRSTSVWRKLWGDKNRLGQSTCGIALSVRRVNTLALAMG